MNLTAVKGRPLSRLALTWLLLLIPLPFASTAKADRLSTIERVKGSVVGVGTFERTRAPQFKFLATGFAVGDGTLIVTNAHALPSLVADRSESMAVLVPASTRGSKQPAHIREANQIAIDSEYDLAVLKVKGPALPALKIRGSAGVVEGQEILFTGFPIGAILGPYAATHRGIVSAITPIAIPQARGGALNPKTIRRLSAGSFPVFQLDATAYPGNSGSPVYDPETGEVIGVINMVLVKATKESVLTNPSGITYAIPSNHLQDLLNRPR